jgi:hypothetical protein
MQIQDGSYVLELLNEPTFVPGAADNFRSYAHEYVLVDVSIVTSRHGLSCHSNERVLGSAVMLAGGGASGVHPHSMIARRRRCYVAVGDHVLCMQIPDLDLLWKTRADHATVFGIYFSPDGNGLVVHGELDISMLTMEGDLVWSQSGADIFSGEFILTTTHAEVEDWDKRRYRFRLTDGEESA